MVGLIIIVPLIIFVLFKSIVRINNNEVGMIKSGEKIIIVNPGYRFVFPFQIFRKLDISTKTVEFNVNEISSKTIKKSLLKSEIITSLEFDFKYSSASFGLLK